MEEQEKKLEPHALDSEGDAFTPVPEGEAPTVVSKDTVEDLKEALATKTEEAQGYQDRYLRLAAEFENYKRRAQRDQQEFARYANETVLKELLTTVDNLERAVRFSKEQKGGEGLLEGVELTLKQLMETLTKFGVRPVTSLGEPFDPSRHQAVARTESQAEANTVVDEYQKGYFLHDRILRPAMVTVATEPSSMNEPQEEGRPADSGHVHNEGEGSS